MLPPSDLYRQPRHPVDILLCAHHPVLGTRSDQTGQIVRGLRALDALARAIPTQIYRLAIHVRDIEPLAVRLILRGIAGAAILVTVRVERVVHLVRVVHAWAAVVRRGGAIGIGFGDEIALHLRDDGVLDGGVTRHFWVEGPLLPAGCAFLVAAALGTDVRVGVEPLVSVALVRGCLGDVVGVDEGVIRGRDREVPQPDVGPVVLGGEPPGPLQQGGFHAEAVLVEGRVDVDEAHAVGGEVLDGLFVEVIEVLGQAVDSFAEVEGEFGFAEFGAEGLVVAPGAAHVEELGVAGQIKEEADVAPSLIGVHYVGQGHVEIVGKAALSFRVVPMDVFVARLYAFRTSTVRVRVVWTIIFVNLLVNTVGGNAVEAGIVTTCRHRD